MSINVYINVRLMPCFCSSAGAAESGSWVQFSECEQIKYLAWMHCKSLDKCACQMHTCKCAQ